MPTKKVIHKNVDEIQSQNAAVLNIDATVGKLDSIPSMAIQNLTDGQILSFSQIDGAFVNADASSGSAGAANVSDLLDVDASTPTHGQALTWNLSTQKWVAATVTGSGGGGGGYILGNSQVTYSYDNVSAEHVYAFDGNGEGLPVDVQSPVDGQVLVYSGTNWVNGPAPASDVESLDDTTITNIQDGDVLVYSGGQWVNQAASLSGGGSGGTVLGDTGIAINTVGSDNEYVLGGTPTMQIELTTPTEGQIMMFQSGKWVNAAAPTGGIATITQSGSDTIFEF
jgi:hypothetical protein